LAQWLALQQPVAHTPSPVSPQASVQAPATQVGVLPPHETQATPPVPQVPLLWSSGLKQVLSSLQQPDGQPSGLHLQVPSTHESPIGQSGVHLAAAGVELPQPARASAANKRVATERRPSISAPPNWAHYT
jgi:hypothetical protein